MKITLDPKKEMDVRVLEPIQRHIQLLAIFKELAVDDSFIFINDHDPIPLYYELKSIHGDVVGWEYLQKGGRDWRVKVTRLEASKGKEFNGVDTLIDLRKTAKKHWKQVVFHRFGMMKNNGVMQLHAPEEPSEIRQIFSKKYTEQHEWNSIRETPGDYCIHIKKILQSPKTVENFSLVNKLDLRPYPPAERHERFYKAFATLKSAEAFEFYNDHDPKPLYYQMEAESKSPFTWEYLEDGPEVWKVRVTKP